MSWRVTGIVELAAALVALLAQPVWSAAAPVIHNPTDSQVFLESSEAPLYLVLPPRFAAVTLDRIQLGHPNLAFCHQMDQLKNASVALAQRYLDGVSRLAELRKQTARYPSQELEARIARIQSDLAATAHLTSLMYAKFATLEGGFAKLDYDSRWEESVVRLRELNPGVRFEPAKTRNLRLHIDFPTGSANYLSSLPIFLRYWIADESYLPLGEDSGGSRTPFTSRISGTFDLSLLGACPARRLSAPPSIELSASYEYEAGPATTGFSFTANLFSVYRMIRSSSAGGVFFSEQSWQKTMNQDWAPEALSTEASPSERREIQAELVKKVLRLTSTPWRGAEMRVFRPDLALDGGENLEGMFRRVHDHQVEIGPNGSSVLYQSVADLVPGVRP